MSELKPTRDLHTSGSAVAIAAKTAPLVVRPFQDDHEAWDRFVCEHSSGSPFT